jgi:hypothetical protein
VALSLLLAAGPAVPSQGGSLGVVVVDRDEEEGKFAGRGDDLEPRTRPVSLGLIKEERVRRDCRP